MDVLIYNAQKRRWEIIFPNSQYPKMVHGSMCSSFDESKEYEVQELGKDSRTNYIIWIKVFGKIYNSTQQRTGSKPRHSSKHQTRNQSSRQSNPRVQLSARAPYNFVSLPDVVVPAEKEISFDKYEGNSGVIEVRLVTETDFFTRGNKSSFYKLNDQHAIPGSSLRGMIRTLVEIMSYSKMAMVNNNQKLFYRNVVEKYYRDQVADKNSIIKSIPAYLKKTREGYLLVDAKPFKLGQDKFVSHCRINRDFPLNDNYKPKDAHTFKGVLLKNARNNKRVYFESSSVEWIEKRKPGLENTLNYHLITDYSFTRSDYDEPHNGLLVTSGFIPRKHMQWVIGLRGKESSGYTMSKRELSQLLDDSGYKFRKQFLSDANKNKDGVPCFYLKDDNGIKAISHTPFMRLRYLKSIGDKILYDTTKVDQNDGRDIAQSIFGMLDTSFASKVFFEDLLVQGEVRENPIKLAKILSSPKPTSFTHYLVNENKNLQNYNGTTSLRGFKNYWHKAESKYSTDTLKYGISPMKNYLSSVNISYDVFYKETRSTSDDRFIYVPVTEENIKKIENLFYDPKVKSKPQNSPLKTLKTHNTFKGQIRYDNLTDIELGALLFALNLPDQLRHKLGMGKSLGLGTVKIEIHVSRIDRKERYKSLIGTTDESGTGKSSLLEDDVMFFKNKFEAYLKENEIETPLWPGDINATNKRFAQLYHLLYWDKEKMKKEEWHGNVAYMSLPEFKRKQCLPETSLVYEKLNHILSS